MKKNAITENYRKSWKFIKESQNFIYVAVLIFFTFFLIGFLLPMPDFLYQQIVKFIEQLLQQTEGMSYSQLTSFIFFNNLHSSFFAMILGVFFGIFPMFVMVMNGYLVGVVSGLSVNAAGVFSLWKLLPHGIFELPAVFISAGLGLKIGSFIWQKKKIKALKEYFLNSLRVFVFIVIPLLIIAAIIEGTLIFVGKS